MRDGRLGNLSTPKSVQKLQMALHAKAKTEAGYRFYALYDKIYREDILAHAYAQCRSKQGHAGCGRSRLCGPRGVRSVAVARGTGDCTQGGNLPTKSDQTSVYPESQRQTQAAHGPRLDSQSRGEFLHRQFIRAF